MQSAQIGFATPGANQRASFDSLAKAVMAAWAEEAPPQGWPKRFVAIEGEEVGAFFGWDGERATWANGRPAVRWAQSDRPSKPLAQAQMFRETMGPLLADRTDKPIAVYYYDLRPTWEEFDENPEAAGWQQMSWHSLEAVGGATFVEEGGYRNRHYWKVGAKRSGLFEHSQAARLNREWLKRVPADASGLTTGVWDAFSFCVSVPAAGAWLAGADEEVVKIPTAAMLVHPIVQPLLQSIGPRYLVYRMPGKYGSFPFSNFLPNHNLVALVELRDREAFQTAVRGSLATAGGMIPTAETQVEGYPVLAINAMYFTAYIATLENEALIALHPQLLKDALENWRDPGPALVDTPAFKEAEKYLLKDACFLMYFPPGGFARGIYDEYIPQLQQLLGLVRFASAMFGAPGPPPGDPKLAFDPLTLPRGRDIARHVNKPTILSARDDGTGVLFDGYAPVLSTPYYWAYVHALTRLHWGGRMYLPAVAAQWLLIPPAPEEPATQPVEP